MGIRILFVVLVKGLEFRETNAVAAAEDEVVGRFTTPDGQMESHSQRFGIVERNFLEHSYLKFVVLSLKFFVVKCLKCDKKSIDVVFVG